VLPLSINFLEANHNFLEANGTSLEANQKFLEKMYIMDIYWLEVSNKIKN